MNTEEILEYLDRFKKNNVNYQIKREDLALARRIIIRLDSFSNDCDTCQKLLKKFSDSIKDIEKEKKSISNVELKSLIKEAKNHLVDGHGLVPENHYTDMYMSYGVALGLIFGSAFSQLIKETAFIGIGLPIGIGTGLAIGSKKDEEAKKEGKQI